MTVRSVYNPNVATIGADADVVQAATQMRQQHVGDLVVTGSTDGQPVGVITDRDIVVEIVAKGIAPADIRVGDMLKRDLLSLREDNGLEHALSRMRQAGVRRAPVVDGTGRLVGVLTLDDVIDHLAAQLGEIAETIRGQQALEAHELP